MTKDEVLALGAGREMDEAVAVNVMEWTVEPWSDEGMGGHNLHGADGEYVALWDAPPGWKSELDWRHRWSPSHEWNATGQVIRKMRVNDFWFSCSYKSAVFLSDLDKPGWFARFRCVRGGTRGDHFASADTFPLAVCRAALLVVGE